MRTEAADVRSVIHDAIAANRLTHALLLKGRNLEALVRMAHEVAGRILGTPVDKVEGHADFFLLRPTNKMRQINVVNTRELIRLIQHSPSQGSRKVALVMEVDRMNREAANAFLKTLEEPPDDTTIILVTVRPHAVLETILSRCLGFWFSEAETPLADPAWMEWLEQFADWLQLASGPIVDKRGGTLRIMRLYGLIEGFERCQDAIHASRWESESAGLRDGVTDEEKDALEVGVAKSVRDRMLGEMELCLRDFAMGRINLVRDGADASADVASRLAQCVSALERLRGLLELNLSSSRMLEAFLLNVLRVWSAKR